MIPFKNSEYFQSKEDQIFQFGPVNILFETINEKIFEYIRSEYNLLSVAAGKVQFSVLIDDAPPNTMRAHQNIAATGRSVDISYVSPNTIQLRLPKDSIYSELFKIINPSWLSQQEAAMVDFLHNLFLGILQTYLLNVDSTLFHASSFRMPGSKKAIVMFGAAQSGKSTLVNFLTDQHWGEIISEDFCIVSDLDMVYSLPHKSRVHIEEYENLVSEQSLSEKLNRHITKVLGKELIRILPFEKIYKGYDFVQESEIDTIYLLMRDQQTVYSEACAEEYFVEYCISVLSNEFNNLNGFQEYFLSNPFIPSDFRNMNDVLVQTEIQLRKIYNRSTCKILHVPMSDTPEKAAEALRMYLSKGKNGNES